MKTLSLQELQDHIKNHILKADLEYRGGEMSVESYEARLISFYVERVILEERKRTWEEACRAQKLIDDDEFMLHTGSHLESPLAEFKP